VAGAFGVKGEIRIHAYTERAEALLSYGALVAKDGSLLLNLTGGRVHKGGLVARANQVETREQAEALRGTDLFVPRERLPAPDEDEFYIADLIGLAAVDLDGAPLGVIKSVADHGAGDILEIAPPQGASWLVAFTRQNAPEIRFETGEIVIVRPAETSETDQG
jgi:16S rRNA processing protein RimM